MNVHAAATPLFKKVLRWLFILAIIECLGAAFVLAPRLVTNVAGELASRVKAHEILMPLAKENELISLEEKNAKDLLGAKTSSSSAVGSHQASTLPERRDVIKTISSNKDGNTQPGATLALISVQQSLGNEGEHVLKIAIKSQVHDAISVPDVKVQVYFYDDVEGEIVASKFPVASRWLSLPIDWKNADPQLLEVIYQPDSTNNTARYVGYIVAVYYKGELQGYRVDPPSLTTQFPIKVYIGNNEL